MDRTFIKYSEALKILEENKTFFSTISVPINESGGRYLAEDLIADRDFPPYHRVTMDGIAIGIVLLKMEQPFLKSKKLLLRALFKKH